MKVSVNCPSYKRPKVKTLQYLPFCRVWVDEAEAEEYRKQNKGFEQNIIAVPSGVQGNVARIRNWILDKVFDEGFDVCVMVDDDMDWMAIWNGTREMPYDRQIIPTELFLDWVEKYSKMCFDLGFKMWGVNCNKDPMSYSQYNPFSFTAFVGGPFQCFLNNPLRYDERLPLKEDYDMTLQQCNKYRGVLRLNFAHYSVQQSTNKGGCASMRNRIREKEQFELLQKKWGGQIVRQDKTNKGRSSKTKNYEDYNPIIKIPIKGI